MSSNLTMMVGTITLNKTTISCVVVATIVVYGIYVMFFSRSLAKPESPKVDSVGIQQSGIDIPKITEWKDKTIVDIPHELTLTEGEKSEIKIEQDYLQIDKTVKISYRYGGNDLPTVKGNVLLLHGAAFSSDTWTKEPVWTMQQLIKFGYKVIALDLPGYGNSKNAIVKGDPGDFMLKIISQLDFDHPVIVSPSMSGKFSLPLIIKDSTVVRGFVPVAPTNTDKYLTMYKNILVPTLIIYGEKDTGGKKASSNLKNLPNSIEFVLKDANHPAYLDQPERFHQLLYNFLLNIPADWSTTHKE